MQTVRAPSAKKWRQTRLAWGLLLPSVVFLSLFTLYPIGYSVYMSLFKNNMSTFATGPQFIGIKNYVDLFTRDAVFRKVFVNNLVIAAVTIPASVFLAVGMAIFANKVRTAKGAVRVAFFYPTLLPMVAVANIWLFIYTPMYGLLGYINQNWRFLAGADTVLWALIAMLIWKQAGYVMIFYIAGLQNINQELYEAARIDGANALQSFRRITWPLLKPTTIYVTIITMTNAYKMVDHLYIMTKGGPDNASNMLLFYVYQKAFDQSNTGMASAITVILIGILLIATTVQFFSQDRRTFYA
ncbi:MAG TPA: sugar ABC transporter permease [Candidatus Limnocylindria bacterium]|nr:sugar ABC transporter permease [Candidatus Limnocylindria bacterium]